MSEQAWHQEIAFSLSRGVRSAFVAVWMLAGCGGDGDVSQDSALNAGSAAPGSAGDSGSPIGGSTAAGTGAGGARSSAGASAADSGGAGRPAPAAGMGGGAAGVSAPGAGAGGVTAPPAAGGAGAMTVAGSSSDAGSGGTAGGVPASPERTLPAVTSVDMPGPFAVMVDQRGGANSWVFRPTELGKDGAKHPVLVFGNGAGGTPSFYMAQMTRIASHGIIVVHPTSSMVNAGIMKAALDWILAENMRMESPFYQKLNGKAAMGGHSLGSLATFDQEAMETRLATTLHIAGGSMDRRGSSKVKTPTAYICGDTDFALPNCETDFETVEDQPTFFSVLDGTDHIPAVGRALPGMVAWLRWHVAGETERKAQFTGPDGDFFKGIWKSQTKNW